MIAELTRFFRRATQPLGRAYWWPGRSSSRDDAPGVLLVSFAALPESTRLRLLGSLPQLRRHPLLDGGRPGDDDLGLLDSRLSLLYRLAIFVSRTLRLSPRLLHGELSWSEHLCECEGLARAHQAMMQGRPYHHLGDLLASPRRDLSHLFRLLRSVEHRRYEIWLLFRDRHEAYLPSSLALPEEPLAVAEIEELARHRSDPLPVVSGVRTVPPEPEHVRLMTYNVHSGIGLDGRLSLRRLAEVLERYSPHFVALQEVDVGRRRSEFRHQVDELARLWPSQAVFFPALHKGNGQYGLGCLSRLPLQAVQGHPLEPARNRPGAEPRVAIQARLQLPSGRWIRVINTHLGLTRAERLTQIGTLETLLAQDDHPVVLLGDLNCAPHSPELQRLCRTLRPSSPVAAKTWFGAFPVRVLDYALVGAELEVAKSFVPIDGLTRLASDHLPLIVDLRDRPPAFPPGLSS